MKDFQEIVFDPIALQKELTAFGELLESQHILSEQQHVHPLFKASPNLTAYIGTTFGLNIGISQLIAYEFNLVGDYVADIVFGNREKQFCMVELEDGDPKSVLAHVGAKANKEWGRRFDHGFSQLVDWFCLLDDFKQTARFKKNFGYGHIDFVGLLLIGRNEGLDEDDLRRMRWRRHKVIVDSHPVLCMTYDELYDALKENFDLYADAFKAEGLRKDDEDTA